MRFLRSASKVWRASNNTIQLCNIRSLHLTLRSGLQANFLFPILAALLAATFYGTQKEVNILVGEETVVIKTHMDNVGAVLKDAGITIQPGDIVLPTTDDSISENRSILIRRSKPVVVIADGNTYRFRTQSESVGDVVRESGLNLRTEDTIYVDNTKTAVNAELPSTTLGKGSQGQVANDGSGTRAMAPSTRDGSRDTSRPTNYNLKPIEITIDRSVPIYLHDGETHGEIYTTRQVLGDAITDHGVTLQEADLVFPPLGTEVTPRMHLFILRAKPITIKVDGRTIQSRTQSKTIGEAIVQEGVKLVGKDRVEPPRETFVESNVLIRVTRIKEDLVTEQEPISYATEYKPDPTLEIDEQRVVQEGRQGLRKRETRVVYENGEEVSRTVEKQWVESLQVNKVIGYGTKIVIRELSTPEGTVSYWRKLRVWATWYNASHGGKSPDNPAYGITRTGVRVTRGVIAVDPNVIPLGTPMYVPDYGVGVAADTGGAVKGMIIDLGFEESDLSPWSSHSLDIYFLTPVPPPSQIRYW